MGFMPSFRPLWSLVPLLGCAVPATEPDPTRMARWKELPVRYKVASTFEPWAAAEVRRGFDAWNDAVGAEIFVYDGIKRLGTDELSGDHSVLENVVHLTERPGDPACAAGGESCGPLARVFLRGASAIVDADIYLFQFEGNFVTGRTGTGDLYSIADVILHEAGHILWGAPESTDPTSAVYPILYPVDHPLKRSVPTSIDRAVVKRLYANDDYFDRAAAVGLRGGAPNLAAEYATHALALDEAAYR